MDHVETEFYGPAGQLREISAPAPINGDVRPVAAKRGAVRRRKSSNGPALLIFDTHTNRTMSPVTIIGRRARAYGLFAVTG